MKKIQILFLVWAISALARDAELLTRPVPGTTPRLSANGDSLAPLYSPDGNYLLFASSANDLVDGHFNARSQVFLKNLTNGTVRLLTPGANGPSQPGGISADNRYVVIQSEANNLTDGDTNSFSDIYLRDLSTDERTLVSAGRNRAARDARITADGEWVLFSSALDNHVYAWRRTDGALQLVSDITNTNSQRVRVNDFDVSTNNKVVFVATGANMFTSESSSSAAQNAQVYLRDLASGQLTWVTSVLTNRAGFTNANSLNARITPDGNHVFFMAVPKSSPSATRPALFRYKVDEGIIDGGFLNVTNAPAGLERAWGYAFSDDGKFMAFVSSNKVQWLQDGATNTVVVDTNSNSGFSDTVSISHNGRYVAFVSTKTNLIEGAGISGPQLYLRDMETNGVTLISRGLDGHGAANLGVAAAIFSPDDSTLVFESTDDSLVEGDTNERSDIFAYSIATQELRLLTTSSQTNAVVLANGPSVAKSASANGKRIAITSQARLDANDTNLYSDVYLIDRVSGANILLSSANTFSGNALLSSDGSQLAFESLGNVLFSDLATGQTANIASTNLGAFAGDSIFFAAGGHLYRSNSVGLTAYGQANAVFQSVSADGSRALYLSSNNPWLFDFNTGESNRLVGGSMKAAGVSGNGQIAAAYSPYALYTFNLDTHETNAFDIDNITAISISANGNILAFENFATTTSTLRLPHQIAWLDLQTGRTNRITTSARDSVSPVVSDDGRFIAFESFATDLVAGDSNATKDVFLYDRALNRVQLVSHRAGSSASANGASFNPFFSADSSTLFFQSAATDLADGDLDDRIDVFAYALEDIVITIKAVELQPTGERKIIWNAPAGARCQLEFTTDLTASEWTNVGREITASENETSALHQSGDAQGFYRVRLVY
jgi:Tol biopolymer transport system component